MYIHNFLCDLLCSIKILFDNYLFIDKPGFIKSYEFNLGNRTFQLGDTPAVNYALPSVIVSINDEVQTFGSRRTDLINIVDLPNINRTNILYNKDEKLLLSLHEEYSTVNFNISINCESQLQSKEIAFNIKRHLPLYKNLNLISFISFFEIPIETLLNFNFKIPFQNIDNLYTRINQNTGKLEYCYGMRYEPLVRLESISSDIPDSSSSTFQTQMEILYHIQFPHSLYCEEVHYINSINISFTIEDPGISLIPYARSLVGENQNYVIDRTLIVKSESRDLANSILISKTEDKVYLSIKFSKNDFIISKIYKYRFHKVGLGNFENTYEKTPDFFYEEDNKVVFIFDKNTYNKYIKPELISPLFVDFYYDIIKVGD